MFVELIFWFSLIGASYSYLLYPIILLVLPKRRARGYTVADIEPAVSVIVTVYNEEARIADKIRNTLQLDYPRSKFQFIVASDCSSDKTEDIVKHFSDDGVQLVRAPVRKGKENAQAVAIGAACGEILVFSDAATRMAPSSLRTLIGCFEDKEVGAVSSEDRFLTREGKLAGEGAYIKYEMWLRRLEASVNGLVGLSGSLFGVRRELCFDWPTDIPSDFNAALNAVRMGYRTVMCPALVGIYDDVKGEAREYRRKYRTVLRGIYGLSRRYWVLNPFVYGLFAFQVFSHKLMRWMVPWFLLGVLVSSAFLSNGHWFYNAVFWGQVVLYAVVALGATISASRRYVVVRVPYFFFLANLAVAHAMLAFLSGKRIVHWEPSSR